MFSFLSRKLYHTAVTFDLKLNYSLKKRQRVLYREEVTTIQHKEQKRKHTESGLQLLIRTQTWFFTKNVLRSYEAQLFGHNDHCQIWRVGAISIILLLTFKDGSIGLWIALTENI